MPRFLSAIGCIAAMALICGCASNPVQQFYSQNLSAAIGPQPAFAAPSIQPQLFRSADVKGDGELLQKSQYRVGGWSSFNSAGNVSTEMIVSQARAVQADLVLFSSKHAGDRSGVAVEPFFQLGPTVA